MTLKELGYELIEKEGKYYYSSNLYLQGTDITTLPDNLVVYENLHLDYTNITTLPNNLVVGGFLSIGGTKITSLPNNLVVVGSLWLRETNITSLPDKLIVGGSLYLNGTKITSFPNNLVIGGSLDISDTNITSLPDNLVVGDSVCFDNTMITREEVNKVNHNVSNVLFWKDKEYVKVEKLFYRVISNNGSIYQISKLGSDYKVHYPYYLITNKDCNKYIIENNLDEAKKRYNLLNTKKE